jgi:oxygen-independent coproporphyrinogen-3 oxidase
MVVWDRVGVYVHIPFCTKRCDYCAFATWTDRFHLADHYIRACASEAVRAFGVETAETWYGAKWLPASTVFFGGGTPSLLTPEQVEMILASIPRNPDAEVTLECNPETVDEAKLTGYRAAGVTRLSFGIQSMAPHVLAALGRGHDPASVYRAVEAAGGGGFAGAYNVDLIFGAAGESVQDWEATLSEVLNLDPPPAHVSAYALTVEAGTPLAATPERHPDPDDQAEKYRIADELLESSGFAWYEISNWARPGRECQHNQLYWDQAEYLGIGCAAHSHRVDRRTGVARRWWNIRSPERYVRSVEEGRSSEAGGEDLSIDSRSVEGLELSLRTRTGIPEQALPGWQGDPDLAGLVEPGLPGRLRLTLRGRLLANEVALRIRP